MSEETLRSIEMSRLEKGRYLATNTRGGQLVVGQGGRDEAFSPVELLLVAIAGCSAIDVDYIVGKRAEPTRLDVRMTGDKIRDERAARVALARHQRLTVEVDDQGVTLAAFDKATERLVGDFVLILRSVEHRRGEVGYVLHPDFAGRGLATEGARVMLDIAFEKLGLRRVIGRIDARNQASARVLTKLGLRHEAHLVQNELFKGEWTDEDDFAILHDEWQRLRSGDVEKAGTAPSQG